MTTEHHLSTIGSSDAVDDADEGRFSGTIGSEQSENFSALYVDGHVVEGGVLCEPFADVVRSEEVFFHDSKFVVRIEVVVERRLDL